MQNQAKIFLTFLLIFFSVEVFSQSLVFSLGGSYTTGVFKFGENSEGIDENYKGPGICGGASFEGLISENRKEEIIFSLGLLGDYKMTTQKLDMGIKNKANLLYLNIPAYLYYRHKLRSKDKIYAGIGPYMGIGISGNIMGDKVQWGDIVNSDHLKRMDYGVSAKIGYRSFYGFDVSAAYDFGIPDVFSYISSQSLKYRTIRLSVAYAINLAD